ncbi:MAG: methylmalonate-semialdehyde dehydrogenase (acylating) [Ignavibacteria bacterium GWB2_35_6b]|nr:MAG: methylmalonate-semialdehyde dehydrogenase (acylating) [Ignavibacteria bacterium GWB2_35_6b]
MEKLKNYINGQWTESNSNEMLEVTNPATASVINFVPLGCSADVNDAAAAAKQAFKDWRNTPITDRIQYLFKMKKILEDNVDEISKICTMESGKTFAESKAEMKRAVENIEVACGMPQMMQGDFSEDIANGIDEFMIRQPLGVAACIAPFNFPIMIPFWFMPYAIASGNCYIIKPSEKVPGTMVKIFELIEKAGLPKGVLNLVHGGEKTVNTILEHEDIQAISFVGSTKVARHIYATGTKFNKRVQAQGGAKNPVVIMPDADLETTSEIIVDSVYGCAGQRCLAASNIILVGKDTSKFREALVESAKKRVVGYGLESNVQMGPVITNESKERVYSLIQKAIDEGANLVVDGRNQTIENYGKGYFIKPTILENLNLGGEVIKTEIFGPVMSLINMKTLEDAIDFINKNKYGNAASIFTNNGSWAREFRRDVNAGNIGINIGIAAPMAFFPFSGWKDSFLGDLHAQSKHAIEFYTQTKVVIERWNKTWSRKF